MDRHATTVVAVVGAGARSAVNRSGAVHDADAEELPPTRRHWYLGVLHGAAPARVVPMAASGAALAEALGRLPTGRWWHDVDRLLVGVEQVVPDQAGVGR